MNIGQTLLVTSSRYPDKTALVDTFQNIKLSYKNLNNRVNRLANALLSLGIQKGDRISILLVNCFQYVEITYAAAKLGAIMVPLNYRLKEKEIKFIIQDCTPKLFIVGNEYREIGQNCSLEQEELDLIMVNGDDCNSQFLHYERLIQAAAPDEPKENIQEQDIFGLMYTSGTTGMPKGVIHTHRSLIEIAVRFIIEARVEEKDHTLIVSPLFHLSGFGTLLPSVIQGAQVITMKNYDPELFLKTISDYKITFSLPVPTMITKALEVKELQRFDYSSLRLLMYGGASIPTKTLTKAMEIFKCDFLQGYGLTEGTPLLILTPGDHRYALEHQPKLLEAAGRSVVLGQVKIVDDNGNEVGPGEMGEIIAQTRQLMNGYWQREEETIKTLKDGWLYTGDIGIRDEQHYIYIMDRKKDMIISGGENIYPAEVEKVIEKIPQVLETAVIGVPDREWGESVKAFVVFKEGQQLLASEIIEYCKNNIASYKKPSSIEILPTLPRNAGGKVLKNILREPYWRNRVKQV
ncbi:long-chain-fatty-acid--CoA ligase [Neobacillus sp. 114]|uniref:long-chain-fatty-acid--CoA ligase n=1 Tax=Neobacillus sp. 114 TaxID=3048535 RepID=UPI0024C245C4|nr:long-chain-fatty-acid--CoA ligase [Neobacillus sp. 114]